MKAHRISCRYILTFIFNYCIITLLFTHQKVLFLDIFSKKHQNWANPCSNFFRLASPVLLLEPISYIKLKPRYSSIILYRLHTCSINISISILSILRTHNGFLLKNRERLVRLTNFHKLSPCVANFYRSAKLKLYLESPLNQLSQCTG